jgi:hypothetical protein
MIYFLIFFKKCYLTFLFSFIIGTPASWSGNGRTGLYFFEVKGTQVEKVKIGYTPD